MGKVFEVIIDKSWCKGCSLCVDICPKQVLGMDDRQKAEAVEISKCIGCHQCENICPDLAITVKEAKSNG